MILHQWRYNAEISIGRIESSERSKMVIDSITNVMVDTVHEFLPRVHAGWKKSRHPQGIQSVFMAAKGLKATMNNEHGLRELLEMLRVQSRRWCIASEWLAYILCWDNTLSLSQRRILDYWESDPTLWESNHIQCSYCC